MRSVWVHGCDSGRVPDGSRLALYQTLSIEYPSSIFLWHVLNAVVHFFVVFVLFLFSCFRVELCRCSYDIFLSNKPRTGMVTTYITGYG